MTGKTHLIGGVGAAAIYLTAAVNQDFGAPELSIIQMAISVPLCLAGSLLPDIDLRTSTAGKEAKILSTIVNAVFGHRTFFHSPLFLLILFMTTKTNFPFLLWCVIPLIVGCVSHLVLDMLNRAGVPLFWPFQARFWIIGVKTGGKIEKLFDCGLAVISAAIWVRFIISFCVR